MAKGIFIVGTDTDVGKTFVTAGITYALRNKGYRACSYKPVQSGGIREGKSLIPEDVRFVQEITGIEEPLEVMNRYCLEEEVSPHLAAEIEGVKIEKEEIINGFTRLSEEYDYIIVEGCGGIIVPLIRGSYYLYDLVKDLGLPVVIVTKAGVGTINHTSLTVDFLKNKGIDIKGVLINGYSGNLAQQDNIKVIRAVTGLEILGILRKIEREKDEDFLAKSRREYEKALEIENILKMFS
jgi:dethiobiotin synthetase